MNQFALTVLVSAVAAAKAGNYGPMAELSPNADEAYIAANWSTIQTQIQELIDSTLGSAAELVDSVLSSVGDFLEGLGDGA